MNSTPCAGDGPNDCSAKALEKCFAIERQPASEQQTMATLVCSAALRLAELGKGKYVDGLVQDLHRAADYIASTARTKEDATPLDDAEIARRLRATVSDLNHWLHVAQHHGLVVQLTPEEVPMLRLAHVYIARPI